MRRGDGDHDTEWIRGSQTFAVDFDDPEANNWLAVNQFGVTDNRNSRRPDIVLFFNGLPLGIMELKNAADEDATVWSAFDQRQTYKAALPTLFSFNETLLVSDGVTARIGALTSGREWFKPWSTVTGEELAASTLTELQVMLQGVFDPRRFLALLRDFIVFEDGRGGTGDEESVTKDDARAGIAAAVRRTTRSLSGTRTGSLRRTNGWTCWRLWSRS